jgi:hypothetical protein
MVGFIYIKTKKLFNIKMTNNNATITITGRWEKKYIEPEKKQETTGINPFKEEKEEKKTVQYKPMITEKPKIPKTFDKLKWTKLK